jgi:uncharacterized membrane protein
MSTAAHELRPATHGEAERFAPPLSRMVVALLALLGIFVSGYLALYKLGYLGALQCGATGGCEVVQASDYSMLLGLPVALWGTGAYVTIFVLALLGLQPRWAGERWLALFLVGFSAFGVAFSAYLTYLSGSVIGAFCQWCLVSAALITLVFLATLPGLRHAR